MARAKTFLLLLVQAVSSTLRELDDKQRKDPEKRFLLGNTVLTGKVSNAAYSKLETIAVSIEALRIYPVSYEKPDGGEMRANERRKARKGYGAPKVLRQ